MQVTVSMGPLLLHRGGPFPSPGGAQGRGLNRLAGHRDLPSYMFTCSNHIMTHSTNKY
jgi:hypothetical protein